MSVGRSTRRNRTTVLLLSAVIIGMVGLSAAAVPLYRLFCQATGYGGTTQRADSAPKQVAGAVVTVRFTADTANDLGWDFAPLQRDIELHPGEQREVFYRAVNHAPEPVTGTATYNVTPAKAGIYFDKIQCFCFNEQRLAPGEGRDMGVVFFVDPDLLRDPSTRDVRTITLSYTMFRARSPEQAGGPANAAAAPRAAAGAVN